MTKECSKGLGQDRHLYALYCLLQRELRGESLENPADPDSPPRSPTRANLKALPDIFTDPGYDLLGTSIISTSNCGNPALRLFGFGPVAADGYGIGYIIKDDGISVSASSKHLQTRRFLDTLASYLRDVQAMLVLLHRAANAPPTPFIDHSGILRDARTGRKIHGTGNGHSSDENGEEQDGDDEDPMSGSLVCLTFNVFLTHPTSAGYSFFDSGDISMLGRSARRNERSHVGKVIPMAEY